MSGDAATISLSLISHTNAGKTTLARTLLGRDVGEVRDAQHVTQEASAYRLVETPQGDALELWDTPGFGDSVRLARRLAQQGNPVGWFLSQVWDRFRDQPFYLTQLAVRNVRERADVVLYLVNASEAPDDAGYLGAELDVLAWIGKPVVIVLNQTGRPRPAADEQADVERWKRAVGTRPLVHAVTSLDAFARCWVQEIALFRLVEAALPESRRAPFRRLADAWQARRRAQFDDAMAIVAAPVAFAACDREPLPEGGVGDALREIGRGLGIAREAGVDAKARAADAMAMRLDDAIRASTDRLIALHGLDGKAKGEVIARLSAGVAVDAPVDEKKAAVFGGVISGAISGLAADLAAGGFTFGAGMLAGAVLGALGGAGIARGMNLARGRTGASLRWDDAFLGGLVASSLLRYLAVAHYGRGRGDYVETEYPPFWPPLVAELVGRQSGRLAAIFAQRDPVCDEQAMATELRAFVADVARETLARLYPDAPAP